MGRTKVLLTIEYEIFGSGAGDVRRHVIEPTRRMAAVADRHGIPLVIYFEVEEDLAFERHAEVLRRDLGYDPAALMREQARELARRGHDIQLDLHPQWHEARYEKGHWHLQLDKLTVDSLFPSAGQVAEYVADRKRVLEQVVGDGRAGQTVCAYRAGGFAAQPCEKLLRWIRSAPPRSVQDELDVLVLIGHNKEHRDDAAFDRFLSGLVAERNIEVTTFSALRAERAGAGATKG